MTSAERALNQGEASDTALIQLQEQLLAEADQSSALFGLRGERAMLDDILSKLASGEVTYRQVQGAGGNIPTSAAEILSSTSSAFVRHNQALAIERLNEAVEIAKRPLAEQPKLWIEYDKKSTPSESTFAQLASSLSRETLPSVTAYNNINLRHHAQIFGMVTLLAAERHRLAHGTFPERRNAIDPKFLRRSFVDPFSGTALQMKSDGQGGLIVYSVGYDRVDNGGEMLDLKRWMSKGSDLGYHLRALTRRKRPPKLDTLPEDVFQKDAEVDDSYSKYVRLTTSRISAAKLRS